MDNSHGDPMTANTKSKSTPFAWQDKRVLKKIRDGVEDYGTALAVYTALTIAASDKQSAEFATTHGWLAMASGVATRTVKRRLADLKRIGVVEIVTPSLRAPCTYKLLASDGTLRTLGHGGPALGNGGPAIGHGTGPSVAQIRRKEEKRILGTAARIGLERKEKIIEAEIGELNDRLHYEHDREANPGLVDKRERLKADLQGVRERLKGGIA